MGRICMKTSYDYIDPLIDTGKPKQRWVFFQSASLPFGMIQLSPDTDRKGTWGVGYRYFSKRIKCFSHIHQWQLSCIAILPIENDIIPKKGYSFSHRNEIVKPGYHSLYLNKNNIQAELTATTRVGLHRYTFKKAGKKSIMIDLINELGPSHMSCHKINIIDDYSISGYVENAATLRRPKPCKIFFHISCDHKINISEVDHLYFMNVFDETIKRLHLKVAVSFVSEKNAQMNMESELNNFDFDQIVKNTIAKWNEYLSVISIKSTHKKFLIKFYTDLWRIQMGGHITSDVNGQYLDMTGKTPVTRKTNGYQFISNADIFWGAHFSVSILYDLLYPTIKSDYVKSLIQFSENGGYVPRGPSGGNYTNVMIAAHSGSFIISAFFKGINDFDTEKAYIGILNNHFKKGLMSKSGYEHHSNLDGGIDEYMANGYIPVRAAKSSGIHCDSASMTVEYAYDDWCLSNFAKTLGKNDDYLYFLKRSKNYLHLFDQQTKFIRPKNRDGSFVTPFDPRSKYEFCEGNSWSYTYYVPHDIKNIIKLTGGNDAFNKKLNSAFKKSEKKKFYAKKPKTKRHKAYINYGNENMRFTASLFHYSDAPELAQKWTRKVKLKLFSGIGKNGFREDDDCGLSAGTSLLLGLGLFDFKGGAYHNPSYLITAPLFDEITINLDATYYSGKVLIIKTYNNHKKNYIIEKIIFNKETLIENSITHQQLIQGGLLEIYLTKSR